MSDYCRGDDRDRSAAEFAFAFLLTAFIVWVIYEILCSLFGTPEGRRARVVLLPVGAVVGIASVATSTMLRGEALTFAATAGWRGASG